MQTRKTEESFKTLDFFSTSKMNILPHYIHLRMWEIGRWVRRPGTRKTRKMFLQDSKSTKNTFVISWIEIWNHFSILCLDKITHMRFFFIPLKLPEIFRSTTIFAATCLICGVTQHTSPSSLAVENDTYVIWEVCSANIFKNTFFSNGQATLRDFFICRSWGGSIQFMH